MQFAVFPFALHYIVYDMRYAYPPHACVLVIEDVEMCLGEL